MSMLLFVTVVSVGKFYFTIVIIMLSYSMNYALHEHFLQ